MTLGTGKMNVLVIPHLMTNEMKLLNNPSFQSAPAAMKLRLLVIF
jgi:hypothetical protein